MREDNIGWNRKSEPKAQGDHKDYPENLSRAKQFIQKVKGILQPSMSVAIRSSHHLENSLLWIVFCPPIKAKIGGHAAPVFLHQPALQVKQETEYHFSRLSKKAREYWEKNPTQLELLNAPKTRLNSPRIDYRDEGAMEIA